MKRALIVTLLLIAPMRSGWAQEAGAAALLADLLRTGATPSQVANEDALAECEGFLLRIEDGAELENPSVQRLYGICSVLARNGRLGDLQFVGRTQAALGEDHAAFQEAGDNAMVRGPNGDPISVAHAGQMLTVETTTGPESDFAKPTQIALISTAGALVISSAALAVAWAFAEEKRLGVEATESSNYADREDAADHTNTMGNAAIITGSVGVAIAVGTLTWILLDDTAPQSTQGFGYNSAVVPTVGPDQVGLVIDLKALFGGN